MSLVENLTRRIGRPPIPTGPEQAPPITAKIAEAEAQRDALLAERPERALDAVNSFEGAEARLAEIDGQAAQIEKRLDVLRAAHSAALRADERMFRAQRAALHSTQVAVVKRNLRARDEAADKLSRAIGDAVAAYRALLETSAKAQGANPLGGTWPDASLCGSGELYRAVAKELRRQGTPWPVTPENSRLPSFPTDKEAVSGLDNPGNIRPLTEAVHRASEHVLDTLTGRTPK